MFVRLATVLIGLWVCAPLALSLESHEVHYGDYTVYYNVFPSESLLPQVARATGIRRAESQLVLTMVVRQERDGQQSESIQADIDGNIINIYGQVRPIRPRQIKDQGVIYYIHDFAAADNERLKFSINVTPRGADQPLRLEFAH